MILISPAKARLFRGPQIVKKNFCSCQDFISVLDLRAMPSESIPVRRSRLYERTIYLLRNRPITKTLKIISVETNLPEGWLLSILNKPYIMPAVDRVEILYEYLSGKQLDI